MFGVERVVKLNCNTRKFDKWRAGGNESVKYWIGILNRPENRGIGDILCVYVDEFIEFGEVIQAVFLNVELP